MIKYIENGDIFALDDVYSFAHGCNCAGAMGKGIALQFREKFPEMFTQYKDLCLSGDFGLGDVYLYQYEKGYVFNLGTQKTWKTKAEIIAIEQSLNRMFEIATLKEIKKIAIPKIGAGLGGLDWNLVKNMINDVAQNYDQIDLYIVENYVPYLKTKQSLS